MKGSIMEIIIAIAVVAVFAGLLIRSSRSKSSTVQVEVPYKVEAPVAEPIPAPVVEEAKETISAGVPAGRKPRKPRSPKAEVAVKKPAAKKTAGRKPKAK
jgi:hypothetical protein